MISPWALGSQDSIWDFLCIIQFLCRPWEGRSSLTNYDLFPPFPFELKYNTVLMWVPGSKCNSSQAFLLRTEMHSLVITHLYEQGFQECDRQKVSNLLNLERWNVAHVNLTPIISTSWRTLWFFKNKTTPFWQMKVHPDKSRQERCARNTYTFTVHYSATMYKLRFMKTYEVWRGWKGGTQLILT